MAVKEPRNCIRQKRKGKILSKFNARFLTYLDPSQFQIDVNSAGFWWFSLKKGIDYPNDRQAMRGSCQMLLPPLLKVTLIITPITTHPNYPCPKPLFSIPKLQALKNPY
jgi:hypothetical protein